MKLLATILLSLTLGFLGGCATSGSYCDVARPIYVSVDDKITSGTATGIVTENEKYERICGVK